MASSRRSDSTPDGDGNLEDRVERLEQKLVEQHNVIEDLRAEVQALRSGEGVEDARGRDEMHESGVESSRGRSVSRSGHTSGSSAAGAGGRAADQTTSLFKRLVAWGGGRSEDWLNYVGIGLLLFGLAFLFKYSVDRGWLVPVVRVAFGALLGTVLLVGGLQIYERRHRLRRVLLGGSSATYYATVFAAYQLYALVAYPVAFGTMVAVTVITIALAMREEASGLAIIGTIGGLGTPFLLFTEAGSVGGLAVYTCIVIAGACAVFLVQGWRFLLYTTVLGGWLVFLVSSFQAGVIGSRPSDAWALQVGIGVAWLLLSGTPVIRMLLGRRNPGRWPLSALPRFVKRLVGEDGPTYGLVVASPLMALLCSRVLWTASSEVWASVAGAGAAVYAVLYAVLRRRALARFAPSHGLVAAVLTAYALGEVFHGSALLLAWGAEGLFLLAFARRLGARSLRVSSHTLLFVATLILARRIGEMPAGPEAILQPAAVSELVLLGFLVLASVLSRSDSFRWTYRLVVLGGWLAWWAAELAPLTNGHAYISSIWATTAVVLLAGGAWVQQDRLQVAGLATLSLFVGKLFLVDLASLAALWRVGLFLGSGAAFLGISYLLPGVLGAVSESEAS